MKFRTGMTTMMMVLAVAGCQANEDASNLASGTVDARNGDITMLQAWLGDTASVKLNDYFGGKYKVSPNRCEELERREYKDSQGDTYYWVSKDCRDAIEQAARLDGHQKASPMITAARHEYYEYESGDRLYTISGMCELVEFRTVMADEILNQPTFKGVGFYLSRGRTDFIDKDRMHKVGSVTLKDGRAGSVHRFIAQGMCFGTGGNGGSIADRQYLFRPFARFEADGTAYNNWDNVATDYLLGRNRDIYPNYVFVRNFDRQTELLRQ